MRMYQQEPFRGLPSNQPLKSPSPDLKGKNAIGPTVSPHQISIRKSMSQFTPPNRAKKITYMEYSTLPANNQKHQSSIQTNIQHIFQPSAHQKQYSSTHAKGHYNFELPKELIITTQQREQHDLISTGKKSTHKRNLTHSYIEPSSLHQTHTKSHREDDLIKTINEKDMIIQELKQMINLMTENGRHLKNSQRTLIEEEYESMKNEVRILTIENQKLAEVIQKLKQKYQKLNPKNHNQKSQIRPGSKQRSKTKQKAQKSQRSSEQDLQIFKQYQQKLALYEEQMEELKARLEQKQANYEKDLDEMIQSHKSLALECKMFENQKEQFSRQNQRLINLLRLKEKEKQTCYANYAYVDKKQYQSQQTSNTKPPAELTKSQSGRLAIQKIKAQYEQNLKQYKQNVYNQVYNMFDTINATLEEINQKINLMDHKLNSIQKFRNSIISKTTSHLTSLEQNEQQTIKKSAIYIEDPPSSQRFSSKSNARDALSVILEQSRRDNEKLELQLSQLRREVEIWRKKAQKELQENDKRVEKTYSEEEISSYQQRIKQLEDSVDELREEKETSEKEIIKLTCEILKAEENHITHTNELTEKLKEYEESLRQQTIHEEPSMDNSLVEQLKSQAQSLKQQLESRRQESARLRQQIAQMEAGEQAKEKQLLDQIDKFHITIKETEENFNIQKKQNQAEKQSLLSQINSINHLNRTQAEQIHSLKHQLKNTQEQIQTLLSKIHNLQSKLQSLQHQVQQQQQAVETLQNQNQALKNKLQTDSQKYLHQIHKFTADFQQQLNQYIQDIQSYKSQVATLKLQNQSYHIDNQKYQQEILHFQENQQNLHQNQLTHLNLIQAHNKNIQRLQHCVNQLTEQLQQNASVIQMLEQQKWNLSQEKERAIQSDQKLNNLTKNIQKLKNSYKQTQSLDSIKEYISQLQGQNQTLINEKTQLISQIDTGKSELLELGKIRIGLEERVKSLGSTVELYKKELEDTKQFYHNYMSSNQMSSVYQSNYMQPVTYLSEELRSEISSKKKAGRSRIYSLIEEQKHKICNLVSLINTLEDQPQSMPEEPQAQQSMPEELQAQQEAV